MHYLYVVFVLDLLLFRIRMTGSSRSVFNFSTVHHSVTTEACVFPLFGLPYHCGCLLRAFPPGDYSQALELQRVSNIMASSPIS